jgi:hypothetical protein
MAAERIQHLSAFVGQIWQSAKVDYASHQSKDATTSAANPGGDKLGDGERASAPGRNCSSDGYFNNARNRSIAAARTMAAMRRWHRFRKMPRGARIMASRRSILRLRLLRCTSVGIMTS